MRAASRPTQPTRTISCSRSGECGNLQEDDDAIYSCGSFQYYARFKDLSEHEIDHVFLYCPRNRHFTEADFTINPEEAETVKWVPVEELKKWLVDAPEEFTAWFPRAFALVCEVLEELCRGTILQNTGF